MVDSRISSEILPTVREGIFSDVDDADDTGAALHG
jgi:hypothetical protein